MPTTSTSAPIPTDNPILSTAFPIPFHEIEPVHVEPALEAALARAEAELATLVEPDRPATYEATLGALDALGERLGRVVTTVQHLNSVAQSPELREAWRTWLPRVSAFYAALEAHPGLWRTMVRFAATDEAERLDPLRRRNLEKTMQALRRAGAHLDEATRTEVQGIRVELSELSNEFANNLLDGTHAWDLRLDDAERLAGLPDSALRMARQAAEEVEHDGYRLTLQAPSFVAVLTYAEDRELRETMYRAFRNRGSGEGRDNRPLIRRILRLRRDLAAKLGYDSYAELTLEERMVEDAAAAHAFERDMAAAGRDPFETEVEELRAKARALGLADLQPWDVRYVGEQLRRDRFDFDEEELRPYFSVGNVIRGLFSIAERLFGVSIEEDPSEVAVWHDSVRVYRVTGSDGVHVGSFYTDWFPRPEKRDGAWMSPLLTGGPRDGGFEPHLAYIGGNLTPPDGDRDAQLTHDEVRTLFHEFGHLLHHVLSRVELPARAGTNVAWDFVELPSQIMENWIWEREALDLFARHVDSGAPLPIDLFERLARSRTFAGARTLMWGVGLGTLDLGLHTEFDPDGDEDPLEYSRRTMAPFLASDGPDDVDFLATFAHVFAGGYAAGYYSYLWSEVLDADAFGRFREAGIFDAEVGRAFVDTILARGDSADPAELFRAFRGRDPDSAALIRRNLGAEAVATRR